MVNLICQSGRLTEITQDPTNVWNTNTVCGVQFACSSCLIRLKKSLAHYTGVLYGTKRTLEPIVVHISPDQLSNFIFVAKKSGEVYDLRLLCCCLIHPNINQSTISQGELPYIQIFDTISIIVLLCSLESCRISVIT